MYPPSKYAILSYLFCGLFSNTATFVSNEDIKHYYNTAPYIVEGIEKEDNKDIVYDYIYDNVVDYCVTAIENGNYIEAYKRYKDSIINLEQLYARKELGKRLIKTLN